MRARGAHARPAAFRQLLCLVAVAALIAVAGVTVALLLAPAVLLTIALLLGRYPGEQVIRRMRRRLVRVRVISPVHVPRAPRSLGWKLPALAVPGCERGPPPMPGLI